MPSSKLFDGQELSQECQDFISTVPKEESITLQPLYQYQGFWHNDKCLLALISAQKHFQAQDSDVFVVSNPKCGTTWLKSLTFALLYRKQHPVTAQNHPLLSSNAHDLVPYIDMNLFIDNKIPDMESFPSPRLLATHMPYVSLPDSIKKNSKCKLVYVSRDPKDAFVSLWHHGCKAGLHDPKSSMEEAFEDYCNGISFYGPVWDHVLQYWNQSLLNPQTTLFLKYEDMKVHPALHLRRLADFLGCPFSAEEEESGVVDQILNLCSFDHLTGLQVNKTGVSKWGVDNNVFFRRGQVGDAKNYLSEEMINKIDGITRDRFSGSGLLY
ncbi:cytosolic sulfotransferase 5-like [Salvia hispanica]|uniref:cytosolic sulfotransferase 5-like n=1 Tax=Salvia hispanica TaxID=49212 RepID=UPI0020092370|nr:cytosolic sulfotransferase 5-like [Salvia hispanica]